jgi:hypothetical protein
LPPPVHTPLQVAPGAQSITRVPLQVILQAAAPPHTTVQLAAPPHSALQPPLGQLTVHLLSPLQVIVEPVSMVTAQVLPPSQVTWLFAPVSRVHELVPAQLEVQFDVQLPSQVERPAQVLVQPLPQVRSHSFCESQW